MTLSDGTPGRESTGGPLARLPGDAVDRFTVLEPLGEGGMGVVVAAYDPSLDRKVAIKLLHPEGISTSSEKGRLRLVREAQAMARLSHPNVITVYEVGTVGDEVFIAMELVEGETLAQWLGREPRPWREVVRVFVQAGRGLAAAHRAGLVHRDFKPENVLVAEDGTVRVTDFGLAGLSAESPSPAAAGVLTVPLTSTGGVLGTPAYMAPEQYQGLEADARADQFSFCVALYEGLHRARPFGGSTPAEIAEAIAARRIAPASSEVPRWLRAVVKRGLEPDPRDRWRSMNALLDALARDPGVAWRRRLVRGAAAAGLAAIALAWVMSSDAEECPPARDRVAAIWDGPARQKVRAAFLATREARAGAVFERVERGVEDRLSGWVAAHREACRATRVRGEQSETMLDLRMQCLERARRQMEALTEIWQKNVVLNEAVQAALTVGDVRACSDAAALATPVPPPRDPEAVQRLEALERVLDRAEALRRAGEHEASLAQAREAVAEARRLAYAPILAEALYHNADRESDFGSAEVAAGLLQEAFRVANEAHDDVRAASTMRKLLQTWVLGRKRLADADLLWNLAEAAMARVAHRDDLVADLLHTQGQVLHEQGKLAESAERLHRAIELKEKLYGPDAFQLAGTAASLSSTLTDLGRFDEAVAFAERARAIWERTVGREHPYVPAALLTLSYVRFEKGDYDGAARDVEQAVALWSRILPADSPDLAMALHNLGFARKLQERDEEAQALFERVARIREKALGLEHPRLASTREELADLAVRRGDTAAARRLVDGALRVRIKTYGEEHPVVGETMRTVGAVLLQEKDPAGARAAYQRALAIARKQSEGHPNVASALTGLGEVELSERKPREAIAHLERARDVLEKRPGGKGHPLLVPVLTGLGRAHLGAGHVSDAVAALERATAIADANGPSSRVAAARARFQLAKVLWESGERARSAQLTGAARDALAGRPEVDEIDRWRRRAR
jgi:tetratricopeptide (TPR) repeat protein